MTNCAMQTATIGIIDVFEHLNFLRSDDYELVQCTRFHAYSLQLG
jgi:hypothetical protein